MARRNQGPKLRWLAERGVYYITWTVNGRSRKCSTGTADREQAEAKFGEWLQLRKRRHGPSDPGEVLVTDVLSDYAAERGPKIIGQETMGRAVETLAHFWEGRTVAEAPLAVPAYLTNRGRAAGTTRRELGVLQAAINHAYKHGRLTRSVNIELPPNPPPRKTWLTRSDAAKLIRAARKDRRSRLYMPLFILIGLYTGRRKEAILSLRWPRVDLKTGIIDFEIAGRQRTKKRRGEVPIPSRLLAHLRRARRRGSDLGPVLHINGRPIANIKKGFSGACRRAGLSEVTPHTLRHTCATWLMQAGVDMWAASGFLAMSMKTLTSTYGHHHPEWLRGAAEAFGSRRATGAQ